MLPINVHMGHNMQVNATEVVAIIDFYPEVESKLTIPLDNEHTPKCIIITSTGSILPAYVASNILTKRWKEAFESCRKK